MSLQERLQEAISLHDKGAAVLIVFHMLGKATESAQKWEKKYSDAVAEYRAVQGCVMCTQRLAGIEVLHAKLSKAERVTHTVHDAASARTRELENALAGTKAALTEAYGAKQQLEAEMKAELVATKD